MSTHPDSLLSGARLRRAAVLASIGAAAIHLGAAHPHLAEYGPAGAFMVASGIAQLAWAFWIVLAPTRGAIAAGLLGNAGIVALWAVSRTAGLPFGEMPWVAEHVHATDALCTGLEALLLIACAGLLRPSLRPGVRFTGIVAGATAATFLVSSHDPTRERMMAIATATFAGSAFLLLARARAHSRRPAVVRVGRMRTAAAFLLGLVLVFGPVAGHAAEASRTPRGDINIVYDGEFDAAHGIRSGKGTMRNPYVISGYTINNISIRDTTKAIRIIGNTITGTLRLNWVGAMIEVRGNEIGDLRVNENTARWGDNTGGVIVRNTFGTVGQLRHFDGYFSYNTVGQPQSGTLSSSYPDTRAVNFDGFNGGHFTHNTIYGYVDARLHGHHHSSAYGAMSHSHSMGPHDMDMADHTKRYHVVTIDNNTIYTSHSYALAYLDTNHAGNDRTANSETNPWLNAPHRHFTRISILSNRLFGAGILVNVFNAEDEKHVGVPSGVMDIAGNRISLERPALNPFKVMQGIEVDQARYLTLKIRSNVIAGAAPIVDVPGPLLDPVRAAQSQGSGVLLNQLDHASVYILTDQISNRQFGVRAITLTKSVVWIVRGLSTTNVQNPVAYDGSVANAPQA